MLFKVVSKQKNLKKFVLKDNNESLKVLDMHDFNKKIEEDEWNEALYSLLIKKFFSSNVNIIHLDETHKKQIR